jgi:hypothetical protein
MAILRCLAAAALLIISAPAEAAQSDLRIVDEYLPLPMSSTLGAAWLAYVGPTFPTSEFRGEKIFAPWDLYAWWQRNKAPMHDFRRLEEWRQRDFAKRTVIPMYESQLRQSQK